MPAPFKKSAILSRRSPKIILILFVKATDRGLELEEAIKRANEVNWSMTAKMWEGIIVNNNGTINAYAEARDRTAELIAYLIGRDEMTSDQLF